MSMNAVVCETGCRDVISPLKLNLFEGKNNPAKKIRIIRIIPVERSDACIFRCNAAFCSYLETACVKRKRDFISAYTSLQASHLRLAFLESIFLRSVALRDPESKTVVVYSRGRPQTACGKQRRKKERGTKREGRIFVGKRDRERRRERKIARERTRESERIRERERRRDCAKIGRPPPPPSKLVGLEELCELFLPVCPS